MQQAQEMAVVVRGKLAEATHAVLVSPQREECAILLIYSWMTRQIVAQVTNENEWDAFLKSQLQQVQAAAGTEEEVREYVEPMADDRNRPRSFV